MIFYMIQMHSNIYACKLLKFLVDLYNIIIIYIYIAWTSKQRVVTRVSQHDTKVVVNTRNCGFQVKLRWPPLLEDK